MVSFLILIMVDIILAGAVGIVVYSSVLPEHYPWCCVCCGLCDGGRGLPLLLGHSPGCLQTAGEGDRICLQPSHSGQAQPPPRILSKCSSTLCPGGVQGSQDWPTVIIFKSSIIAKFSEKTKRLWFLSEWCKYQAFPCHSCFVWESIFYIANQSPVFYSYKPLIQCFILLS